MSVFYYEPFYNWDRIFDEFNNRGPNLSQQLQRPNDTHHENQVQRFLKPRMDLHENPNTNTVTATFEFPGLKKEDIEIDVHNSRMTISAETKISEEHESNGYAVRERRFGKFSRTLQLPNGVKDEDIKASMADGILTITFPKAGAEPERKRIAIV